MNMFGYKMARMAFLPLWSCFIFPLFVANSLIAQTQQFFRVAPRDVSVGQGGTVIIPCEVANRVGQVQWTKDGLTLGYDRSLPGFHRYFVEGTDHSGVFSLKIINATLVDDAIYECQVAPVHANEAIRASAHLNVLLPPTLVEIEGRETGSRLEVREHEEVELRCIVHGAKPKADVVWYRNNIQYVGDDIFESNLKSDSTGQRTTTTSVIKLRPTRLDDQVTWACESVHPAMLNPPMRASVFLSVQYPPSAPVITGYVEGESIRDGETVTLICVSAGGNPLADITWLREGTVIDESYTTSGSESRNTLSFLADKSHNGNNFQCQAHNLLSPQPATADIVLSVNFSPSTIYLIGPNQAQIGDSLSYECETSNANPAAKIKWMINGKDNSEIGITKTVRNPDGGWNTLSTLTFNVENHDDILHEDDKIITCKVLSLDQIDTKTILLKIIYPPGRPHIQGFIGKEILEAGILHQIECVSLGGNPLADLAWFIGDQQLASIYTKDEAERVALARLDFIPSSKDNGVNLRCEASNVALTKPIVVQQTLSVNFAPTKVLINSEPEPQQFHAGTNITLTCTSGPSRPAAFITWWHNGELLLSTTNLPIDLKTNSQTGSGFMTTSKLILELTASHNGAVVTCKASNEAVGKSVHTAITLNVKHKPIFNEQGGPQEISLLENEPARINMSATGNPLLILYKWYKIIHHDVHMLGDETNFESIGVAVNQRIHFIKGVLYFKNVFRSDAGYYSITARNSEGETQIRIKLNVIYQPRIIDISGPVTVSIGSPAHLECAVDANPMGDNSLWWEKADSPDFNMDLRTKTVKGLRPFESKYDNYTNRIDDNNVAVILLTIMNVSVEDAGEFSCVSSNGVGNRGPVKKSTYLLVRHKPIVKRHPLIIKSAADFGDTAILECEIISVPKSSVSWSRGPGTFLSVTDHAMNNPSKYKTSSEMLDPMTWNFKLNILNVDINDYGEYICTFINAQGKTSQSVILQPLSKPDPPTDLMVSNTTQETVSLNWQLGFHGGMDQLFRIRFAETTKHNQYLYEDVFPANLNSFVVSNLMPATEYTFNIMAYNNLGESNYSQSPIIVKTLDANRIRKNSSLKSNLLLEKSPKNISSIDVPIIAIIILSISGMIIIFFIAVFIFKCFIAKKSRKMPSLSIIASLHNSEKNQPLEYGSNSTGSTKSATMELYTTSSYNETLSGGETLSSISEKSSCPSNPIMNFPTLNSFDVEKVPPQNTMSLSTYLVDSPFAIPSSNTLDDIPPIFNHAQCRSPMSANIISSPYIISSNSNDTAENGAEDDLDEYNEDFIMPLYSTINKQRTENKHTQETFEDTESEYAVELRRQAFLQSMDRSSECYSRASEPSGSLTFHHHQSALFQPPLRSVDDPACTKYWLHHHGTRQRSSISPPTSDVNPSSSIFNGPHLSRNTADAPTLSPTRGRLV